MARTRGVICKKNPGSRRKAVYFRRIVKVNEEVNEIRGYVWK